VEKPETIRVGCDVHAWMQAYVHVLGHPYFAVTGPDGAFTLKDVPPGELRRHQLARAVRHTRSEGEGRPEEEQAIAFAYGEAGN
jgi:hypothetical protein